MWYAMPQAVTLSQVQTALGALGVWCAESDPESPLTGTPREVSLMLAVLEAAVVRWQVDQDMRDPLEPEQQNAVTVYAQEQFSSGRMDVLAGALRRLQTATGVLTSQAADGDQRFPGGALVNLMRGSGLVLAAWIAVHLNEIRARQDGAVAAPEDAVKSLAARGARYVAHGAEQLRLWRKSRSLT